MKTTFWKAKGKVWMEKNDDSKLGSRKDMPDDVKEYEKEAKKRFKKERKEFLEEVWKHH